MLARPSCVQKESISFGIFKERAHISGHLSVLPARIFRKQWFKLLLFKFLFLVDESVEDEVQEILRGLTENSTV